jgi:Flp pilus assembly protein TadD
VSCLLAMCTKEVAATTPLLVLLFDRAFFSGSFGAALRARWRVHASLAATWLVLAALLVSNPGRAGSAGFGTGIESWSYLLTQVRGIVHYLSLTFWPAGLVFDHGTSLAGSLAEVWWQAAFILILLLAAIWAALRKPRSGFLAVCFILVLAPSSSVVPVATQTIAEHRMYLPLAAIVAAVVIGSHRWFGRLALPALAALFVVAGIMTFARNDDYRTALDLWGDTANKVPGNPRAHLNLGVELAAAGRLDDALVSFGTAVRLAPDDSDAQNNLANTLAALDRREEALPHFANAVRLGPGNWRARANFGRVLADRGRFAEAREQFAAAAALEPVGATYAALARVEMQLGQPADAERAWREAVRLEPKEPEHRLRLGELLLVGRRPAEAVVEFEEALLLGQETADLRARLGIALALAGRLDDARAALEHALVLDPENALARSTLARLPSSQSR